MVEGFTKRYRVHLLVYCEGLDTMADAIAHEKQIKGWRQALKIKTIESVNPDWRDPYADIASPLIEKRLLALRKADPPSAHWMTESFGSLVKSQPSSRSGSPQEPGRGEGPSRGRGSAWGGSVGRRGGGA